MNDAELKDKSIKTRDELLEITKSLEYAITRDDSSTMFGELKKLSRLGVDIDKILKEM